MSTAPAATTTPTASRSHALGVVFLLLAGLFWSLNGALIQLVNKEGVHPVPIAAYRSLFAGLFLLPFAWGKWHTMVKPGDRMGIIPLRRAAVACVICFTVMTACFVAANTLTESSNAIILQYTSTFWIFGLSPWLLREKPHAGEVRLLLLAMVGIGIIFASKATTDALGLTLALLAGLFYAVLSVMIRKMRDSDSAAITVLNNLGSALLLLPVAWLAADLWLSPRALVLLIIMGIVQFGMPYYLYTLGLARVPAYQASLLTMIEPVLVPVWTYLAVAEQIPVPTAIGGGVIFVALVLFVWRARARTAQMLAEARPQEA